LIGALATLAGCSPAQTCLNVLVIRQPSPVNSFGLGLPPAASASSSLSTRLSEQDDGDAWNAIIDHASATSGGLLVLARPPVGYVLTSASGAQLASYTIGAREYSGPTELIFSVVGTEEGMGTRSVKGSARAMGDVHAVFDLATRRLVQFTPSAIDDFDADDPDAFAKLGSVERSCFRSGD
jgi:hypothetical protein